MDDRVRYVIYDLTMREGVPPSSTRVAAALDLGVDEVRKSFRRLADAHMIVLQESGEILMANPFSAVPTAYRVLADGRWWYANCAWDAFGICAALGVDGLIETSCPDCCGPLTVTVESERPDDESLLFHCLVPAARWWDDIVFT